MILYSKIKIYRNIYPYKFITKESRENLLLLKNKIISSLKKEKLQFNKILTLKKEKLISGLVIEHDDNLTDNSSILRIEKNLYVLININEHITILSMDWKGNIPKIYNKAKKIEDILSKNLIFSYSKRFGFLTTNPLNIPHQMELKIGLLLPSLYYTNNLIQSLRNITTSNIELPQESKIHTSHGFIEIGFNNNYDSSTTFLNTVIQTIENLENKEIKNSDEFIKTNKSFFKTMIRKNYGIIKYTDEFKKEELLMILSKIVWGSLNKSIKINTKNIVSILFDSKDIIKINKKIKDKLIEKYLKYIG